ncbi:SEP2 [Symbiodinium pilosum]|uniref:SEP2 protein n=1 Tax=Symbiodinium pilosum TaxID=2952 RepID=A0A812TTR4_SYMPI|nr:SEP2 [Symbiodinium pilosum]
MLCRMKLLLALLAPIGALKMELTDTNFKKSLEGKNAFVFFQAPWCGHCRKLQPEWDQMAKLFADTPNVIIGQVDCTGSGQGFCGENGVQGYPTLKLWKDGRMQDYNGGRDFNSLKREVERKLDPRPACSLESKDACKPEDRVILEESEKMSKAERAAKIKEVQQEIQDAKTQAAELEKKAKKLAESLDLIKAGGQAVEKVEQLLDDADWRAQCEGRTCIVAFLPHIYDDGAAGRREKIQVLDQVMRETKKDGKSVGFLWSQGGDQFEMEEVLGLQFGFPAVIAVNFGKGRFGVHRGTFDKDSISQFLTSLSRGGTPLAPWPASAKAGKAEAWDGKDAVPPSEDL